MPTILPTGAVVSGADGTALPQAPSLPVVTQVRSVADRTSPAFVACTLTGPEPAYVIWAMPSPPVANAWPPTLTVAPSAGTARVSDGFGKLFVTSKVSTRTAAVEPGAAVAGTRESRS